MVAWLGLAWLWHRGVSIDRNRNSKGRLPRWAIRTPIGSPYLMWQAARGEYERRHFSIHQE